VSLPLSAPDAELPPAVPAMLRVLRLGYDHEPRLLIASCVVTLLAAVPDALLALWLKLLGNGVQSHHGIEVLLAGVGLGVSTTATWLLQVLSTRVQRRFRDRVTIALESHVARLQAGISTIAHHERPELLDRLSVLRNQVFVLDHMYQSLLTTASWVVRLGITVALLASVHPALLLVALFAVPTVLTSSWRPAVERATEEAAAPDQRQAVHLFTTVTTAAPGKEVRVTGTGAALAAMRRAAFERWYAPVARARRRSALWHAAGWALFGFGYVGAIVFVAWGLHRPAGDVLLVLAAGARLSSYIAQTVSEIGFLRGIWLDGSKRLVWLERYAAAAAADATLPAPEALRDGITVDGLSFAYPGTDRLVLRDVSLRLPRGAVVAIVGENGAGKSTLVKLLCKLYEPTGGTISVDGVPLAAIDAQAWRARTAGAFQDFARFEFTAQRSVGLGDLPHLDDGPAVTAAVSRAGADDVIERLPGGLAAQLGADWQDGVDLSVGQWQKVALARGFLRTTPLLVVLDEPTSALDAETEHALFERYATARSQTGITLLVSHRFSTVRMADLIVVLDGSRVAETGTHDELMARGGPYSELYTIQAGSYR
jgi:ATP-binding cassette subfamily B protein